MMLLAPVAVFCVKYHDTSFFATSLLFALPLALLIVLLGNKAFTYVLLVVFFVASLIELVMVIDYGSFISLGNLLAIVNTNQSESISFLKNNLGLLKVIIPLFVLLVIIISMMTKGCISRRLFLASLLLSFSAIGGFVLYKQVGYYQNKLTYRYFIENRVLNRPPYNILFQVKNSTVFSRRQSMIRESESFFFGARKIDSLPMKEAYVLGIGESMRFDNISIGGNYSRRTTPELESCNNLVSFSNYYSSACLTMFSVPQIITRATPSSFELNYCEKPVFQPFKESGFKTFVVVCNNLLAEQPYLTEGVDSVIKVDSDMDIPYVIDSLSGVYTKTMFIAQFLGSHSYYYNYSSEYDLFHPNINSEPNACSDSLYINAYDNTIAYADHILSQIINRLESKGIVSSFAFVSDHGERIDERGGGHGGDCSPTLQEYHTPFFVWFSNEYLGQYPTKVKNLYLHCDSSVSSDNVFYSFCDMGGIDLPEEYNDETFSIFSDKFLVHPRILLPDGVNYVGVD